MDANEPQPILTPITEAAIFLVLTVSDGAENAVRQVLADASGLKRSVGFRVPEGGLTCVVGIGATLWERLFGAPRPAALHEFEQLVGPRHTRRCDARRPAVPHPRAPARHVLRAGAAPHGAPGRRRARGRRGPRVPIVRRPRPARVRRRDREPGRRSGERRGADRRRGPGVRRRQLRRSSRSTCTTSRAGTRSRSTNRSG